MSRAITPANPEGIGTNPGITETDTNVNSVGVPFRLYSRPLENSCWTLAAEIAS